MPETEHKYNYSLFDASKNVRSTAIFGRTCLFVFVPLSTSGLFNVINFILIFSCVKTNNELKSECGECVQSVVEQADPQEVVLHIERMHIVFLVRSIISQSQLELEIEQINEYENRVEV